MSTLYAFYICTVSTFFRETQLLYLDTVFPTSPPPSPLVSAPPLPCSGEEPAWGECLLLTFGFFSFFHSHQPTTTLSPLTKAPPPSPSRNGWPLPPCYSPPPLVSSPSHGASGWHLCLSFLSGFVSQLPRILNYQRWALDTFFLNRLSLVRYFKFMDR